MAEDKMDILDDLFAQARTDRPSPSPDLTARILTDAQAVQASAGASHQNRGQVRNPGLRGRIAQVISGLGGWPALSGLAVAGVAGVWMGFAPPAFLPDPVDIVIGQQVSVDLLAPEDLAMLALED